MNLIIFGPPGSGKGTYAARLQERLGVKKISTGDICREIAKQPTELGRTIAGILEKGELVPDEIIIGIVRERLEQAGWRNFILDGFPRTLEQARALEGLARIDAVILIKAHEQILVEKISARRICSNPRCDGNYNLADIRKTVGGVSYLLPPILPKKRMICDKCGSPLYQREDDKPEVVRKRLEVYERRSKPVLEYYRKEVPFVEVWMNRPPEQVVSKIIEGLRALG
jgi:adenylate kinase